MSYNNDIDELGDNENVVIVMDIVCRDKAAARAIVNMWKKQFVSSAAVPHQL